MKKRISAMTLRMQLVMSFITIILIVMVIGFVYVYTDVMEIVKKRTEDSTIHQFRQVEYSISTFAKDIEKIPTLILADKNVQDYFNVKYNSESEKVLLQRGIIDKLDNIINSYKSICSIIIFTESGEILGTSPNYSYVSSYDIKYSPFYQSALYRISKNNHLSLTWSLEDSDLSFKDDRIKDMNGSKSVLAASRTLMLNTSMNQQTTLDINIDVNKLNSLYKYTLEFENSSIYILDQNSRIISDNDQSNIGRKSKVFSLHEHTKDYGSFVIGDGKSKKQVIFYKMKNPDWILVHEIFMDDYIRDILALRKTVVLIFIVSSVLAFILSSLWMSRVTRPLNVLTNALNNMEKGNIDYKIDSEPKNEFSVLISGFNRMSASIRELINKNRIVEEQKRIFEIEVLKAQINPHFLYNTLNSIKCLASVQKADNIVEAINSLGNMIRPIFRDENVLSSISDEIEYVKNYIRLINLRYMEGIRIHFNIPENVSEYKILRFILQPVVENSVFHGFSSWYADNLITITGIDKGENIELVVSDNGIGLTEEELNKIRNGLYKKEQDGINKKSIGLNNVNLRIKLYFGEKYGIDIESREREGTKVYMQIPKVK